jgi:hypothetical protein
MKYIKFSIDNLSQIKGCGFHFIPLINFLDVKVQINKRYQRIHLYLLRVCLLLRAGNETDMDVKNLSLWPSCHFALYTSFLRPRVEDTKKKRENFVCIMTLTSPFLINVRIPLPIQFSDKMNFAV